MSGDRHRCDLAKYLRQNPLIRDHLKNLDNLKVEWLFRSGEYSSYDLGYFDTMDHYNLEYNPDGRWIYKKYDHYSLTPDDEARIKQITKVPDVEQDLAKLPELPGLDPGDY